MSDWKWCMRCDHHVAKHKDDEGHIGKCREPDCNCARFDWNGELP